MNNDDQAPTTTLAKRPGQAVQPGGDGDLPVVARLIVEIRSDGRRTLARGTLEDLISGERTAIAARGDSPAALLASLLRSVTGIAALARRTARALLPPRRS